MFTRCLANGERHVLHTTPHRLAVFTLSTTSSPSLTTMTSSSGASHLDLYDPLEVIGNGSFGIIRKVRRKADGVVSISCLNHVTRRNINLNLIDTREERVELRKDVRKGSEADCGGSVRFLSSACRGPIHSLYAEIF